MARDKFLIQINESLLFALQVEKIYAFCFVY